jgi:isocitrate/methylisocitrate lyase
MHPPSSRSNHVSTAEARWEGIERPYDEDAVDKLRGTVRVEHTLARNGAEKLWTLLHDRPYVAALGASTGNQAVQQVRAGLEAIYLSGWQVAADANLAREMYPDQGLYPVNSVPEVVRAINGALLRADQIDHADGNDEIDWMVPIVADMEAGFGGHLNVFELTKAMIDAGAAGVHLEDQLASEKKCGHMGGKVLLPTSWAIRNLVAARLAADVSGVPTFEWDATTAVVVEATRAAAAAWAGPTGRRRSATSSPARSRASCADATRWTFRAPGTRWSARFATWAPGASPCTRCQPSMSRCGT